LRLTRAQVLVSETALTLRYSKGAWYRRAEYTRFVPWTDELLSGMRVRAARRVRPRLASPRSRLRVVQCEDAMTLRVTVSHGEGVELRVLHCDAEKLEKFVRLCVKRSRVLRAPSAQQLQ
jgi:hypothetical protein